MKFRWEKKYLYWGVTAFLVIASSIIFYLILSQLPVMKGFLGKLIGILKPVIYGLVFAYLMNPLLRIIEKPIDPFIKKYIYPSDERKAAGCSRCISVAITLICVIIILLGLLWMVIPRLTESVQVLAGNLSIYYSQGRALIREIFPDGSRMESLALSVFDSISDVLTGLLNGDFVKEIGGALASIYSGVYAVVREVAYIIIGFIVAVYALVGKEKFIAQSKKVLYSVLECRQATNILAWAHDANRIFIGYISGKILDSAIIGILAYIIMSIFSIPYKELISVIIGVTNIIPFFGPFIGAIPSGFLVLLISPMKCLTFVIIVLALQQFDGNILGPKILGDVTGLGSFWVICAILVGSGLFGFVGMLIGVPVFAIMYLAIKRGVERALKRRDIPVKTSEFKTISHLDPDTGRPVYFEEEVKPTRKSRESK